MDHRLRDCPERVQSDSTTNVVQEAGVQPYMVNVEYSAKVGNDISSFNITALIDSGSPISIIKLKYVPHNLIIPTVENNKFTGINGTPLEIVGTFQKDIFINIIMVNLKFCVVPNNTISYAAIVGRDFIAQPDIQITFSKSVEISRKAIDNGENAVIEFINELMHIDYIDRSFNISENININPCLSFETCTEIKKMYHDSYSFNLGKNSSVHDFEMSISVKHDKPIFYRRRRLAYSEQQKLQAIVNELIREGIIRPSNSPYASPIVLVRKKSGDLRLCVDYRELNKITNKCNYPTPLIDDQLDRLKDKTFYTTLDLKNGFFHVKMAASSVKYTYFLTPLGQYEFLRIPFGLTFSI
ncbi:uncharacterized protein [Diabrotica undecimpunctata]|uniref:uncharacterized protein n=1 Tax=Diabrotica undecimpunctata TaxID=50387 RepID=UPI003B63E78D